MSSTHHSGHGGLPWLFAYADVSIGVQMCDKSFGRQSDGSLHTNQLHLSIMDRTHVSLTLSLFAFLVGTNADAAHH